MFNNSWIPYWEKFLSGRGHKTRWAIGFSRADQHNVERVIEAARDVDAVLCMWSSLWAKVLLEADVKTPVYVICRSFEMFEDAGVAGVSSVPLDKAKQVFMLNESHLELLKNVHKDIDPIFIKNGIDTDYWSLTDKPINNKIAWVCNINFKKGVLLIPQVIHELMKINSNITLEHMGKTKSPRDYLYLQNIMKDMGIKYYNTCYSKERDAVKTFLSDKRYIVSCSPVEGHPMNILEAASMGCKPLIHRYPGAEHQWPEDWLWSNFDELKEKYQAPYSSENCRQYVVDNYDYKKAYLPVIQTIEENA